jgi:hypothetical protein
MRVVPSYGKTQAAIPMTLRHGPDQSSLLASTANDPSGKRSTLRCFGLLTTTWSARAAGLPAEVSEDSRCGKVEKFFYVL